MAWFVLESLNKQPDTQRQRKRGDCLAAKIESIHTNNAYRGCGGVLLEYVQNQSLQTQRELSNVSLLKTKCLLLNSLQGNFIVLLCL